MMKKSVLIPALASAVLLAACAGTGDESVPIEERGASTAAPAGAGAAPVGVPTAAAGSQEVETRALPPTSAGAAGLGTSGLAAQEAAGAAESTVDSALRDPGSLLSKRVILFDYDSSTIREDYRPLLEAHAAYLKGHRDASMILQGHTDERGSRDYNLALGQRRAESVHQVLTLLGVDAAQIEAVSLGEEKPLQEGHDEAAWAQNRRAEIHYQGE